MAERRMICRRVVETDLFQEMTKEARLLYYELLLRADDDGFVGQPRSVARMIGVGGCELAQLKRAGYIILFGSGVCVLTHWRVNNLIRSDRYHPTGYLEEKSLLRLLPNKEYALAEDGIARGSLLSESDGFDGEEYWSAEDDDLFGNEAATGDEAEQSHAADKEGDRTSCTGEEREQGEVSEVSEQGATEAAQAVTEAVAEAARNSAAPCKATGEGCTREVDVNTTGKTGKTACESEWQPMVVTLATESSLVKSSPVKSSQVQSSEGDPPAHAPSAVNAAGCLREQTAIGGFAAEPAGQVISDRAAHRRLLAAKERKEQERRFAEFWEVYPRHVGKKKASEAYRRLKPDEKLHRLILLAVKVATQSEQWVRDGGRYIPHAATYINGRRWEDECLPVNIPDEDTDWGISEQCSL